MQRFQHLVFGALIVTAGAACNTTQPRTHAGLGSGSASTSSTSAHHKADDRPVAKSASAAKAPSSNANRKAAASMAFPTGDANTSALLVEFYAPSEVRVGEPFDGEILVQNLTGMALDGVTVSQTIDANLEIVRADPPALAGREGSRVWNLGSIPANSAKTITVRGSAREARPLSSCVSASYSSALCANVAVVAPALRLTASGPAQVTQCDEIVYRYVVTNSGTGLARDVIVNPSLPTGLEVAGNAAMASQNVGALDAGQSKEFTLKLRAARSGVFEHTAVANSGDKLSAKAAAVSTKVVKPLIKIEGQGTKSGFAGREVSYDFTVTNTGDGASRDFFVVANVPSGMAFKSATLNGKATDSSVRWDLGELKPGDTKQLSMRLVANQIGTSQITAKTNGACADEAKAVVQTETTGIPALLLEVLDVQDPIVVGDEETYVIEVTNQGTAPATNISINVVVPDNAVLVSTDGSTKSASTTLASDGALSMLPLPTLAPKAKATWRIKVKGVKAGDARFAVQMTSDQLQTPVNETEATTYYQ